MSSLKDGWFLESEGLWPGQRFSLKVEEVLYEASSAFQEILVFESTTYGRVLVLDGVIQLTERDEHAYQEMIAHLPLFAHPNPRRVLIVGGGDGGVLREVARHERVDEIDLCEIDATVVQVAKKFFLRSTASAYDDPRLDIIHDDAATFLQALAGKKDVADDAPSLEAANRRRSARDWRGYDVIIVDSSDPIGPAESLFQPQFYEAMRDVLAPSGIVCTQGECQWLHLDLISNVVRACGDLYPTVDYAYTTVPTYPSGQIGFILCSLAQTSLRHPKRVPDDEFQAKLKYYNPALHEASFVLPQFAKVAIDNAKRPPTTKSDDAGGGGGGGDNNS
ncbi:hypothetical protein CTAYLR_002808 [Chrysophaeum taylorii]|uniref:PABS domain-containing protein n=1 Tax=Chrysophaeum taylorii TaxID=2483200 RepID=A0AAD7XL06_9STRA|nr:hypothetical protein CTAYLR_002808 [Chrysophaeum taylorii]